MFGLLLIAIIVTDLQAQPRTVILEDEPIVYYTFEETAGSTVTDASGNGNDGTYVNATLGEFGVVGLGVLFGEGDEAYVEVPDLGTCSIDYTVELFIISFDAADSTSGCCTSIYSTDACGGGVCTHINYLHGEGGGTELAGEGAFLFADSAVPDPGFEGDPVHVAFVVDGTNGTGAIYVDGVDVSTDSSAGGEDCFTVARIASWVNDGGRFFQGTIDEFAIFDKALSEERIILHATDFKAGEPALLVDSSATQTIAESHPAISSSTTFTVVLNNEDPNAATVTLTLDPNDSDGDFSELDIDLGAGTATPITLSFTSLNWDTPQTVTVTAVDDGLAEDCFEEATIAITSAITEPNENGNYDGAKAKATIIILDNETGCVFVDDGDGVEINEIDPNGTIDSFTYVLNRAPISVDTVITLEETSELAALSATSLTFTSLDWDDPQTVSIIAIPDDEFIDVDPVVTAMSSGDIDPNAFNPIDDVNVNLIEDECGELGFLGNDFNEDCSVNLLDFSLFSGSWGNCSEPDIVNCP